MRRRVFWLPAAVGSVALTALAALPQATAAPPGPFSLGLGEEVFWKGPQVEAAQGSCGGSSECPEYRLRLEQPGARLRVAIDYPDDDDRFSFEIYDPDGRRVTTDDIEAFVERPQAGEWKVRVIPQQVDESSFEMRAKLEQAYRAPRRPVLLKPNLRVEPGYDFSFSFTESFCSDLTGHAACEESGAVPLPPSCAADEMAEDRALRCLRFSFGYQNAGRGPVDFRFEPLSDAVTGAVDVVQRVYYSDGTPFRYDDNEYVEVPAGTATYHKTHAHYHYDNVFGAQLFKVTDPERGEIEPLADVAKRGACAHDYVLVDFERFYQDPQGAADSAGDCNFFFTNPNARGTRIGLSTGWADIYGAGLPDNYVDLGTNLDGRYLLRFVADSDDTITETNERDNVGYAYIRIEGLSVELLERGRGRDPWDRDKAVLVGRGD